MKRVKGFKRRTVKQIVARTVAMKLNPPAERNWVDPFAHMRNAYTPINIGPPPK